MSKKELALMVFSIIIGVIPYVVCFICADAGNEFCIRMVKILTMKI